MTTSANLTKEMMVNFCSQSDLTSIFHIHFSFVLHPDIGRTLQHCAPGSYDKGVSNLANQILGTFFSAGGEGFSWEAECQVQDVCP